MISYRQVRLADTQMVIESFLVEQWEHTGDKQFKCAPNWPVYRALEASGNLLLLLALDDERPVGYLAAFTHPHMNSVGNQVATISTYFIEERPNRALLMKTLLQSAVKILNRRGVAQITAETSYEHSAGRLLTKLGFRPARIGYKMDL